MSNKQVFQSLDLNGQHIAEVENLELLADASAPKQAVRLSQAEQIADDAVQAKLVSSPSSASADTAFTSSTMTSFLAGKQDNMEVDPSSSAYIAIEDGYKIRVKQLLITDVKVDTTHGTLNEYLTAYSGETKQEGDVIILNAAVDNQERSWIKTGSASQDASGYTRLQTDYNVSSIRAMFSAGAFLSYSPATGVFEINIGTSSIQLGGQTLPHGATFTTISPASDTADALVKLEALINDVDSTGADGTATVHQRLNVLAGIPALSNTLGTFAGTLPNDSSIKTVLLSVESALVQGGANLNTEANTRSDADIAINLRIDNEVSDRQSADTVVTLSSINRDTTLQNNIDSANLALAQETSTRVSEDIAIVSRLNVVEASSSTVGSIAKAQADAQTFATSSTHAEAVSRAAADAVLQAQVDAIADAFQYKGNVKSDGSIEHIDITSANHGKQFKNASFDKGDMYKINGDITITLNDATSISVNVGDSLVVLTPCPAGTCSASDFHKWDNTESADILREGELDSLHLERVGGTIRIKADSLGREHINPTLVGEVDSKVEKAGDTMTGALHINKVVTADTGYTNGYDYAAYIKMKSVDTASLTDTQRGLLVENEVFTDGTGSPMSLDFANAATLSSHYKGSSQTMSVALTGMYGESRVMNPAAAVYATGAYGVAIDSQLGVNAGGTFIAQNAATANLGIFSFSDTAGAANNRSAYFALSPDSVDFDSYRVARVGNPLPVQDAAVVIDDYTGNSHALFVNGKSEFIGKVIVPSSAADNEAINGADVKAKQKIYSFDLVDGVGKVIPTPASMDLNKVMWQVVDNLTNVGLSVTLNNLANTVTVLASGGSLTGVTLLLQELSCDVEAV
jgi:hypothetical protein